MVRTGNGFEELGFFSSVSWYKMCIRDRLSAVNRADFIDFLESKMKAEVTNSFSGKSAMTELSLDYIHVKMMPQSSWQTKLLPINASTKLICVVATVFAPACDSHITFYTTDWKELVASSYRCV